MRHGATRRRTTLPHTTWTPAGVQVDHWRGTVRPIVLHQLVAQTTGLGLSRRLLTALLDELHISDDFDALIGTTAGFSAPHYPQLLAIALLLRHSWCPHDLSLAMQRLGLFGRRSLGKQTATQVHSAVQRPRSPRSRPRTLVAHRAASAHPVERTTHVERISVNTLTPARTSRPRTRLRLSAAPRYRGPTRGRPDTRPVLAAHCGEDACTTAGTGTSRSVRGGVSLHASPSARLACAVPRDTVEYAGLDPGRVRPSVSDTRHDRAHHRTQRGIPPPAPTMPASRAVWVRRRTCSMWAYSIT
jgi:hypothetical protein